MAPRYSSLRKMDRDEEIRQYNKDHGAGTKDDLSHAEMASKFGICRSRFSQIVGRKDKEG